MASDKLLALLAGHDSKRPMAFDDIVAASGLQAETVQMLMDHLFHSVPSAVNRAEITRYGKTQMFYWPTGVVVSFKGDQKAAFQYIRQKMWNARQAQPPRMQHTPPTAQIANRMAEKAVNQMEGILNMDTPMDTQGRQPVTSKHLLDAVAATPGIERKAIMQLLVYGDGSNKKQVEKMISNAIQQKAIRQDALNHLYLGEKIAAGHSAPHKAPNPQPETAKPVEQASNIREFKRPEQPEAENTEPAREFTAQNVFVDATGQLNIQLPGKVRMVFPAPDTRRIKAFLNAVDLESLCA